jgi:hypothetical protein
MTCLGVGGMTDPESMLLPDEEYEAGGISSTDVSTV